MKKIILIICSFIISVIVLSNIYNYKNKIYYYIDSKPFTKVEFVIPLGKVAIVELNDEQGDYVVSFLKEFDLTKVETVKKEEVSKNLTTYGIMIHYTEEIVYDDQSVYLSITGDILCDGHYWYRTQRHQELYDFIHTIANEYLENL